MPRERLWNLTEIAGNVAVTVIACLGTLALYRSADHLDAVAEMSPQEEVAYRTERDAQAGSIDTLQFAVDSQVENVVDAMGLDPGTAADLMPFVCLAALVGLSSDRSSRALRDPHKP